MIQSGNNEIIKIQNLIKKIIFTKKKMKLNTRITLTINNHILNYSKRYN